MNITDRPNIKPIRDYSEHDVIPFFATTGILNKGTFVTLTSTNSGNTNLYTNPTGQAATPYQTVTTDFGNVPAYAYGKRAAVAWTVKQAGPTDPVLGVLIYDNKQYNAFGEDFRYKSVKERKEQQVTLLGETTPILKRGLISYAGSVGTPLAGSGATVSGGRLVVTAYSKATSVGMYLSSNDADGFALFAVNCV